MSLGGHHGRYLSIDASTGASTSHVLPDEIARSLIGGVGIGAWLLWRHSPPAGFDPLAPEAPHALSLSPLVGTPLTTSAKFAVVAKSPLTGRIGDALASDRFAIEMKGCGIDGLVISGAAAEWSVVVVDENGARLEPAPDLVGLSSLAAEERLRERMGAPWRFFGIGPAGEALVRYATISGDSRHAGRGGLGAVLGSKRIKIGSLDD
jgi:aldehyde:ferredoxin oxidoreductase